MAVDYLDRLFEQGTQYFVSHDQLPPTLYQHRQSTPQLKPAMIQSALCRGMFPGAL
jgi:hypothetical protein